MFLFTRICPFNAGSTDCRSLEQENLPELSPGPNPSRSQAKAGKSGPKGDITLISPTFIRASAVEESASGVTVGMDLSHPSSEGAQGKRKKISDEERIRRW